MADLQHYRPFRTSLLTRGQLREMERQRPWLIVRDTIVGWSVIIAAWVAVAFHPGFWPVVFAVPVIGAAYYGLAIIGHDGLHRRLFRTVAANDLWNDLFLVGPIGAITRLNRNNHIEHHRATCLPTDPDRHKYLHDHKESMFEFAFFLSGLQSLWPVLSNIFLRKGTTSGAVRSGPGYTIRDISIILGWQVMLIGLGTLVIGWWAYPVLWLLPVYVFAYRADLVRVFCEHSMLCDDLEADERKRLITYTSNWLERQFFAPHNMNFHAAHHLWPSIPYYNLPVADRIIREIARRDGLGDSLIWRQSYVSYIMSFWVWHRRESKQVLA